MCRFIAYLGQNILMEEILLKPHNSIILQSLEARETTVPTNGDGFGLGWYTPEISPEPALFTSFISTPERCIALLRCGRCGTEPI